VTLTDSTNAGGGADTTLVYDLQQALGVWSNYISGLGTLNVALIIDQTSTGRVAGGPTSSYPIETSNGFYVLESSAEYELNTGLHVAGTASDMTITISPAYFQYLCLTPSLSYDSSVPDNLYNPIVVFVHEIMHGLGMFGYYSQAGALPGDYESPYDTFLQKSAVGTTYFTGPTAEAAFGGPVPVTSNSSFYHFGNTQSDSSATPATVTDTLTLDLMNGIVFFFNYQYVISPLDLGVLKDIGFIVIQPPVTSVPGFAAMDLTTGQSAPGSPHAYTGPVAGLLNEYISISPDKLNVGVTTPDWFIHTGSGDDAIAVSNGSNVLDGGTGSNFLTGGSGTDTFFVDDRAAPSDIWSSVVGFRAGDAATIWGVTPRDFDLTWVDGQGATGFTGLTLHATGVGRPTASLTLVGYSQADMTSGRLSVSFGADAASGGSYMFVHGDR
jgi:hypothetical protein